MVNVDKLTYAANLASLKSVETNARYHFEHADICDARRIADILAAYRPTAIVHLAAESHVDRSIDAPADFIETNIVGTFALLQEARRYWESQDGSRRDAFRFIHVSTDEVFGSLGASGVFSEETAYAPNSPYSASKASSDHLVRAWHATFGLPTIITNCGNNFGPCQFPEKLIPLAILQGSAGRKIPVYGRGENIRDWIFVDDHAAALTRVLDKGVPGETYNIGARNERRNIDVIRLICGLLDEMTPNATIGKHESLIDFVPDRPGHDLRYAIDPGKIERTLGWRASKTMEAALRTTVRWYLDNPQWCERARREGEFAVRRGLGAAR